MEQAPLYGEAYHPTQIAERVTGLGVTKARLDFLTLLLLAILAGAYISLGALFYTVVITGVESMSGLVRLAGGLVFSLGLVLVVIGGAELFTGNNLMAMAWAGGHLHTRDVLRNWGIVYLGNVIGCLGTVFLAWWADIGNLLEGGVGDTAAKLATQKTALKTDVIFARGILCNALVCLAVWLAMGGRSLTDRFFAILLPISGFVAMGFEHSIANWFLLPFGYLQSEGNQIPFGDMLRNLTAATTGNIAGGTLLVAGVYWMAYLRPGHTPSG